MDTHSFPSTTEDYYRQMYFEALNLITTCICNRLDQPGYKMYCNIQELLLKAGRNEQYQAELDLVIDFYGSDLNQYLLNTQLQVLSTMFASQVDKSVNIVNIVQLFKYMSTAKRELLSEVGVLLKLLLVMPASNAVSEPLFSSLWRLKTYLRSTMTQSRLNHLMILHIHRKLTDKLNLTAVANEFVSGSEHRSTLFGNFDTSDL